MLEKDRYLIVVSVLEGNIVLFSGYLASYSNAKRLCYVWTCHTAHRISGVIDTITSPRGGGLRKKWSSQLFQICVWKGGLDMAKLCVHTKKGLKSTCFIKCVERVFRWKCSPRSICVYWGYQSVWKMCGKGIIFMDTFHTIRVLSNFAGRAGYATFSL